MNTFSIALIGASLLAAPSFAQAQTIDFGGNGPSVDLRSNKQRMRDDYRDRQAAREYRRDQYERGYDRGYGYGRGREW